MLYIIEPALRHKVIALPFVERYGGIAHPMTHTFGGDTVKTFPVSTSLTAGECFEMGKYANLVPDDRYKSVCYFEGLSSPAAIAFSDPKRAKVAISQTIKFVAWLNMHKLGFSDPSAIGLAALASVAALEGVYAVNYAGASGRVHTRSAIVRLDRNGAFGGYSYVDKQHMFMWPFGFFSIELTTITELPIRCLADIEQMEPINCLEAW